MKLKTILLFAVAAILVSSTASSAQAQWVRFGIGVPIYRPYPYLPPYYARPFYPYGYRVVAPAPLYVVQSPVYYSQPVIVARQYYSSGPTTIALPTPPIPGSASITAPIPFGTPPTLVMPPTTPSPEKIPPPPPQPMMPSTSTAVPPPAAMPPTLVPPMPQAIPAPPSTGTGL